jgi:LuxR family maltose regulon positive regulatory protein
LKFALTLLIDNFSKWKPIRSIPPLIRTKLHRPPMATVHGHREHLLDRLDRELDRPLTLVCAPAGYGKSTLVSAWLEASDLPAAWLSIDDRDNDLHVFLSYFLAAVQTVFPEAGEEVRNILEARELPPLPVVSGCLINALDKIDQAFILVIDDYHLIQNQAIYELFEEVLKHPPHAMYLVLAGRIDPPLSLATLRARGKMSEIRVTDLRFSRKETAEFLQQILETNIEESVIATFEEKTEGWITGLHLAALSLRHRQDVGGDLTDLPDANRFVTDYLVEEILSQQSPAVQNHLLSTSILDRFCAELCDEICLSDATSMATETSGQEFLQLLNKANLFVIHLDDERKWFRYHHLFQNLLSRRLKERFTPEDISVLHIKASNWFAENGHFEEAIQHALAAGDVEGAAEIVGHARYDLMNWDQWHRLERWLKLFSHDTVQQHPHLILLRCWLDLCHWYRLDSLVSDLGRADAMLENSSLDAGEASQLKAEVAAMQSNLAYWMLQPRHGVALAEQVLRDSPDGHECVRSTALLGWGTLCQMLGEVNQGERFLWGHMEDGRFNSPSSRARLLEALCLSYWPEVDTQKLLQAATRLLEIGLEYELSLSHSFARYFLGLRHYERNELNEAVAQFEVIVADPYRFPIQNVTHCSFLMSLCYQALGLPDQARKVATSIARLAFDRGNELFIDLGAAFQADLDLLQGRIAQADQWAENFAMPAPHAMHRFFNAELTFIRVLLARNTPKSLESAADQLDSMHELVVRIHHRRILIDVLAMKALLADALGQEASALEQLNEALTLAEPGELIRPFLDLGQPMSDLLIRTTRQKAHPGYVEQILAGFGNGEIRLEQDASDGQGTSRPSLSNQALVEPLTNREIEILSILAKRLSNDVIAQKLFISPETVKRHLYNIYQKLGVKNRQQAIAKAESTGIL